MASNWDGVVSEWQVDLFGPVDGPAQLQRTWTVGALLVGQDLARGV